MCPAPTLVNNRELAIKFKYLNNNEETWTLDNVNLVKFDDVFIFFFIIKNGKSCIRNVEFI